MQRHVCQPIGAGVIEWGNYDVTLYVDRLLASHWFHRQKADGIFSIGFWIIAKNKLCVQS